MQPGLLFCYNELKLQGKPLAKEDYLQVLEDLTDMQVLNLTLSGGEPLAHPDFWAIGHRARELGFVVRIKSNGHALEPVLARRLKTEVDPFNVDVSLHGACAETHDRQTRVPGSFARLMENLKTMQSLGLRIKLNSALTAWNEGEIEQMLVLADNLGLPLKVNTRVTPRDDGDTTPLDISASVEGMRNLFRLERERTSVSVQSKKQNSVDAPHKVSSRHHYGAGSSTLTVDPVGNVYP